MPEIYVKWRKRVKLNQLKIKNNKKKRGFHVLRTRKCKKDIKIGIKREKVIHTDTHFYDKNKWNQK